MYSTCVAVRHTCTLCFGNTGCVQPHMPTLSVAQCHGALPAFRIRPLMCGQKMRLTKGRPLPYQSQAKRANIASRISSTSQCRHSNLCGRYAEYNVHGHHGLTLPSPAFWCGCVHAASRDCQTVVHVSTCKSMPALSTEACTLYLHMYGSLTHTGWQHLPSEQPLTSSGGCTYVCRSAATYANVTWPTWLDGAWILLCRTMFTSWSSAWLPCALGLTPLWRKECSSWCLKPCASRAITRESGLTAPTQQGILGLHSGLKVVLKLESSAPSSQHIFW